MKIKMPKSMHFSKKGILVIISCCILIFGCKEEDPSLTLPEEKLIPILMDIHFAEAAVHNVFGTSKDSLLQIYYKQIYRMHDITAEELGENIDILKNNPKKLELLYKQVVDKLGEKEKK